MQGCFKPIDALGDIPAAERGVPSRSRTAFGLDKTRADLMKRGVSLTDRLRRDRQDADPGGWPVRSGRGGELISTRRRRRSSARTRPLWSGGGTKIKPPGNGFNLKLAALADRFR